MDYNEKIDNLQKVEYLRGLADGYMNASILCTSEDEKRAMLYSARQALLKCKEIHTKIKD